jgi:thioredoxin 1
MAEVLTDNNFDEKIKEGITLVDFYADWCGPCKMIAPIIDELSNEVEGADVVKLDVDASPETAAKFGIRSIPIVMVFKDGKVEDKLVGGSTKQNYLNMIEKLK